MATYEHLLVDQQDGIITVTFNHPENLNAMTAAMGDEVTDVVRTLNQDHSARVLILTGAGRAFSAGGAKGTLQSRTTGGGGAGIANLRKRSTNATSPSDNWRFPRLPPSTARL